jgi:hypothetical protein
LFANGKILRHDHNNFGWVGWDVERELIALYTTGAGGLCGIGQDIGPIDAQHVFNNPDIADEIEHLFVQGDVWVELYDWTGLWDPFGDCDNWANADHLASGEMRIVSTDNDVVAFFGGHARNNAWGFSGAGRLALDGGGYTNISYHFRQTWNPDKPNGHITERLNISTDPR